MFVNAKCSTVIDLDKETLKLGDENDFEVKGYAFYAQPEDLRKPRMVRVAAVQNKIVAATTEPVHVQRDALHARISTIIKAAAASDVNILCLQELWSKENLLNLLYVCFVM